MRIRNLRDISIKSKIVILVMGISLAALGLTFTIFSFVGVDEERSRALEDLTGLADLIGVNVRAALAFEDAKFANESLGALETRSNIAAAYVLKQDMTLFAWYHPGHSGIFEDRATAEAGISARLNSYREALTGRGFVYSEKAIHLLRPIGLNGETLGYVYLQTDLSQVKKALLKRSKAIGGALGFSLLLAYLLAMRLHTLISKPLDDLAESMVKVAESENYGLRIEGNRRDEFGQLIAGFNHMLGQIEGRDRMLEETNQDLEKRVDRRTLQLSRANEELQWQIKERIRVEQALQESETKYRLLFENTPISLWEEDCSELLDYLQHLRGKGVEDIRAYFDHHPEEVRACAGMVRVLDVNQKAVEMFRASGKSDLLTNLEQVFTEKSYLAFYEMLIAMVEGKKNFETEGANRTLDGEERQFNIRYSRFPEEEYGKAVLSLVDITDSKKAEAALRESEERFRTLVEQAADGVMFHDLKGRFLNVNQRACEILGYPREELLGMAVRDLKGHFDPESLEALWAGMKKGDTVTLEVRGWRKDGTPLSVELSLGVVESNGQRNILALMRDITKRKKMQNELLTAKARLEHLLTSTPAGIYTARASGEGVTFVSDNVRTMLGYEPQQFIENSGFWMDRLHPEDRARVLEKIPEAIARGHKLHEYRFLHSDGSYRWMLDEWRLIRDNEGHPLEIIGYWIDITPRKEAEEKLKASLVEKEVLLQEIHHRVKNNLQIITSLLNLQLKKVVLKETRDELSIARSRIQSMAIIHESLYGSADLSQIDFSAHVREVVNRLLKLYEAKNVAVAFEMEDVSLDVGAAIPSSLIINELMTNALKYAFPDGRNGTVTIRLGSDGHWHTLSVEDDGVGIPDGIDLNRLESLGLHLVLSLVGQLSGTMEFDREGGTRVSIRFRAG